MSKKVKGQKVDLAQLIAQTSQDALPTAPNPNREPTSRGGRGGGNRGDRGDRGDRGGDRGGRSGFSDGDSWERGTFNKGSDRGGGFSDRGGDRNNDRGYSDRGDRGFRSSGGYSGGYSSSNSNDKFTSSERPKLNLTPRTAPLENQIVAPAPSDVQQNQDLAGSKTKDKFESAFSKSSFSKTGDVRQLDDRSSSFSRNNRGFGDSNESSYYSRGGSNYNSDSDSRYSNRYPSSNYSSNKRTEAQIPIIPIVQEKEKPKAMKESNGTKDSSTPKNKSPEKSTASNKNESREQALAVAEQVVDSNIKGEALKAHVESLSTRPSAAGIVRFVLNKLVSPDDLTWIDLSEYGCVLRFILNSYPNFEASIEDQTFLLYEVQSYCKRFNFPKVKASQNRPLIDLICRKLLKEEIIDPNGFISWCDDDNDNNVPGRVDALVQTTELLNLLKDEDVVDEDEEQEEELDLTQEVIS